MKIKRKAITDVLPAVLPPQAPLIPSIVRPAATAKFIIKRQALASMFQLLSMSDDDQDDMSTLTDFTNCLAMADQLPPLDDSNNLQLYTEEFHPSLFLIATSDNMIPDLIPDSDSDDSELHLLKLPQTHLTNTGGHQATPSTFLLIRWLNTTGWLASGIFTIPVLHVKIGLQHRLWAALPAASGSIQCYSQLEDS